MITEADAKPDEAAEAAKQKAEDTKKQEESSE